LEFSNYGDDTGQVLHTKNIGCFKANFSTPPLIILVLNVMIPACKKKVPRRWYVTIVIAYHLNGSAERHLIKVNGCQEMMDVDICHLAL
jgi:hypothetical protein